MLLLKTVVVLFAVFQVGLCSTAGKIVAYAKSQVGSQTDPIPDQYKSINFINTLIMHVGLDLPGHIWPNADIFIPAHEWSDPHSKYPNTHCWHLCTGDPVPGDFLAENNHVAVVTGNGLTTSPSIEATSHGKVVEDDWGFRSGQSPTCWRYGTDDLCSHLNPKTVVG